MSIFYVVVNSHEVVEAYGTCSLESELPPVRAGQWLEVISTESDGMSLRSLIGHTFDPDSRTFTAPRNLDLQFDKAQIDIDEVATMHDVPAGTVRVVGSDVDQAEDHPGGDLEFSSNKPGRFRVIINPIHDNPWTVRIEVMP